jgi:hypothetical protein
MCFFPIKDPNETLLHLKALGQSFELSPPAIQFQTKLPKLCSLAESRKTQMS